MEDSKLTFEAGMEQLEALVTKLESGGLPLEESFKAFESAVALHKRLKSMLDAGDNRIRVLLEHGEREFKEV